MQIKTNRLYLDSRVSEYKAGLEEIFRDFSNSEYARYDRPSPGNAAELEGFIEHFSNAGEIFVVLNKSDRKKCYGYVCMHRNGNSYDIGYCFNSKYHGNGYGREAVLAVMNYLTEAKGIKHFTAGTALNNKPSVHLLEKLGFVLESTEDISFYKDENGCDIVFKGGNFVYAITRE